MYTVQNNSQVSLIMHGSHALICPPRQTLLATGLHTLFGGHTNITLVFLSGQHYLSYDLTISGVDELSLQGRKNCTHGNEILVNLQLVRIHLDVSTYLMICDMTLRSRLIQQRIEISGPGIDISLLNLTLNLVTLNIRRAFSVQINECKGLHLHV